MFWLPTFGVFPTILLLNKQVAFYQRVSCFGILRPDVA
jgi:hypothetical protein